MTKEEILKTFKDLSVKKQAYATRTDMMSKGISRDMIRHHFGSVSKLIHESKLDLFVLKDAKTEVSYRKPILQNFNVKDGGLAKMFKECGLGKDDVLKVIVQPDTHSPDYDAPAIDAVCAFLEDYKPHAYINLGDFIENEPSSHWPSASAKARRLVPELLISKGLMEMIIASCGKQLKHKFFLVGNHEDWTDQLLTAKIPEIYDSIDKLGVDLSIENLLGLKKMGFTVIGINDILRIGHAHFIHGYYTGANHAKKHAETFGVNVYYGHLHDTQSHTMVSVEGVREAASLGCLRTLNAPFLKGKPNNWSHSISAFEFRASGEYTRMTMTIINGVFSYNGKLYDGREK